MIILGGVLVTLVESSLWAAPFLLVYFWSLLDELSFSEALWIGTVLGILVDALSLRVLGVSSLILIFFVTSLWFLKRVFSGMVLVEWVFVLMSFGIWQYLLFRSIEIWLVVFWVCGCLFIETKKRFGLVNEIRLR